ncbi:hypothetical protein O3G_MSEX005084 [Manduca sexta]|uniref:Vacuolar protein sorting-associated protein 11 homolog n=1 Tax=Manduca sexta TaxID=7130 RepID=A0A921YXH6_MANSE|nr:hypothetical protein O3G_MSEX005084 [Manduca sexta]
MAFLEWRRFPFFDNRPDVDGGKIAKGLQDTNVTVATSGNGHVVLCDDTGLAHLISRSWDITTFKAYEITITHAVQLPHDPYLVTIGDDEPCVNPLIKVWDWSRTDRHKNPMCLRVSRAVPSNLQPTPATALAVNDNKNLLAVGFQDGSVSLIKGDITRQRSSKMRTLTESGTVPITGLAFKGTDKLFVVSRANIRLVWLNTERIDVLDTMGAAVGCSVLTDKQRLTVATNDAIYCYTTEGKGPCYAIEGEKVRLDWFRSYLVITTNETSNKVAASTSSAPAQKSHHVTILDIQNKFIVFSQTFDEIDAVLIEWGSFYILTKSKEVIYLEEKDLQSKLFLLFKKNLYDVAIKIASSQHYDEEGLNEIYKQYGDHLYSKGDLKGAIEQYVKTIGWLETSYVIRKYLESRHLEALIQYLEELHKKGFATEDHTTLLLTCYVKIDQYDQQGKLKEFINSKDKAINFDVDVAIKVVRQVSADDALSLAAIHKRHDWYMKVMLEDKKDYKGALDYIEDLEFEDADIYMKKYGHRLMQHEPEKSTQFLKLLCTDYVRRSKTIDKNSQSDFRDIDQASPDDYIHMFLSNSARLIEFLEHVIANKTKCSELGYNALIEHYIHVWNKAEETEKKTYEDKVLQILKDPDSNYDKDQTLIICQMLGFKAGMLYLYEENKLAIMNNVDGCGIKDVILDDVDECGLNTTSGVLWDVCRWREQVALHMRNAEAESALEVCRRRGAASPRLWLDVLWWPPPPRCLPELLHVIDSEKLLSPILVIDCLTSTSTYTLGDVRKYLMDVLKAEREVITREKELADKYRSESARMKEHIQTIQHEPITFQSSRCAACTKQLTLPSVYFLCQHSFHQDCFQTYSECERECPMCAPRRRRPPVRAAEALHARLHSESDP